MEQPLKQRLVGAAVIIAVGIIVIPMLLDGAGERQLRKMPDAPKPRLQSRPGFVVEEKISLPSEDQTGQIVLSLPEAAENTTSTDDASSPPAVAAVTEDDKNKTDSAGPSSVQAETEKPKPVEDKKPQASTVIAKPSPTPPDTEKDADSSQKDGIWVVQVGSFTDAKKAFKYRDDLRKKHYEAFVEKISGRSGQSLFRVRIGPLPKREQADELSAKLKLKGIKGFVTRHP